MSRDNAQGNSQQASLFANDQKTATDNSPAKAPKVKDVPIELTQPDNPAEFAHEWMRHLQALYFHYSFKVVNSKAKEGGARLGKAHALKLPHLSGRTLLADRLSTGSGEGIELDYIKQDTTKPVGVLRYWLGDTAGVKSAVELPVRERQQVVDLYQAMSRGELPDAQVPNPLPIRVKQLLLPRENGEFVSVTPLPSLQVASDISHYCRELSNTKFDIRKQLKDTKRTNEEKSELLQKLEDLPRFGMVKKLPVGGAKPNNVGSKAFVLTRPVVFDNLPQSSKEQRAAFGIAYNGVRFYIPKVLVQHYEAFLEKTRGTGERTSIWGAKNVEAEIPYLKVIAGSWINQAGRARKLIEQHASELPTPLPFTDKTDGSRFEAWLNPALRSPNWLKKEARTLAKALQNYSLGINEQGQNLTLGLDDTDTGRIAHSIITWGLL
ncbi:MULTISPECIES: hypothetical protein [unclassified Marinobacter]|jgi:hypothetical protein|uniref:hypothetical protein n=1 Tax=unclassified Marinobacter TaxID=83889 RepID=UPI00200EAA43|nr:MULTISPECIES: hypothetical protein [unclassified Marinobacter]MCL1478121.1 hypothetical protein [Marinobacter sp.]MCL1480076.1 hypothetical protein [Marinobacter sp.]MCL1484045.1 hypothetical protein [Marinobacter sp.]MCL1487576.1 hypothetical protein [Marinobacter sp.]UQG55721.1 hypothetical protein MIH16_20395 [Marinobacter sp. M4C]